MSPAKIFDKYWNKIRYLKIKRQFFLSGVWSLMHVKVIQMAFEVNFQRRVVPVCQIAEIQKYQLYVGDKIKLGMLTMILRDICPNILTYYTITL